MKKNYFFLLFALLGITTANIVHAQRVQPCGTDEMYKKYKLQHPEISIYEQQLKEQTEYYYKHGGLDQFARTTGGGLGGDADTMWLDIPVVVHVIHNYGAELISDKSIRLLMTNMNNIYSLNYNYSAVVVPFKPYVGKAFIRFHLATIDPNGNPTRGITHHFSYLTFGGDDEAKFEQWPPTNYYNIWFENRIGATVTNGTILAYSNFPTAAAAYPYNDGVIAGYNFINFENTVEHETGHYFNLLHTWNSSGQDCGVACGDDEVDDTPPTKGHYSTCPLGDTACAANYFKIYEDMHGINDSLVDYPDLTNVQNIMDYSSCVNMFTKGQVARMRATLHSSIGGRSNLHDTTNLYNTGVWVAGEPGTVAPYPVLPPVVDYATFGIGGNVSGTYDLFTCPGVPLQFSQKCWNDSIESVNWTFGSGATIATSAANVVNNSFSTPGWSDVTLAAKGIGGTTTTTFNRAFFVADAVGTSAVNYMQEFTSADTAKWPMFNYYNNEFKWQYANVGYYDNSCVEYVGYDSRLSFSPLSTGGLTPTGTPGGDFDDLYTMPFNLTGFSGNCYMNFYFSGASRSSNTLDVNDRLNIQYSVDSGRTWVILDSMLKGNLDNMGENALAYIPTSQANWSAMSIQIPAAAKKAYTLFRFRYLPGNSIDVALGGSTALYFMSSGNNFYMDRLSFNSARVGVPVVNQADLNVVIAPNPTFGNAYVIVKDADNTTANVIVTDITGKVVYTTSQPVNGAETYIEIPHTAISVPGVYIVQTATGTQSHTQKLVVE